MKDQSVRTAIANEAMEWFVLHRGKEVSQDEDSQFVAWLKSSPMHVEEYLRIAVLSRTLHSAFSGLAVDSDVLIAEARAERNPRVLSIREFMPSIDREPRRWRPVAVAAVGALLVIAVGAGWMALNSSVSAATENLVTGAGQQRFWQLSDGSELNLDANSAVVVRYSSKERVATIRYGQVLFIVAHDPARRFRVVSGKAGAIAVGTEFDVMRAKHSTLITVVQGKVAVFAGAAPAIASQAVLPSQAAAVNAGEEARLVDGPASARPSIAKADVVRAIAWAQHAISFDRQPLGDVANEFNRYSGMPIIIQSPKLRDLRVSGIFNAYDAESLLEFISRLEGVEIRRTNGRILVVEQGN